MTTRDIQTHFVQAYGVEVSTTFISQVGGDREMADILALVLLHDENLVEQAVAKALELGVSIGTSPNANLVNTMLDTAIETLAENNQKPIAHSDRGGHYRWPGWLSRVAKARLTRSMSRKACWPDNAVCEGFFGRLKTEMFYPGDWHSTTIAQFIEELDTYIRWYNEKRIKSSLGYLSPIEYRESLGLVT